MGMVGKKKIDVYKRQHVEKAEVIIKRIKLSTDNIIKTP